MGSTGSARQIIGCLTALGVVVGLTSCTRALGIWGAPDSGPPDAEPPDATMPDAGPPEPQGPCGNMGGLDSDAPWPMVNRCPSQASFIEVTGPASPQVLWTVETESDDDSQAVVAGGETVYVRMNDSELYVAVCAIDRRGTVLWKTGLATEEESDTDYSGAYPVLSRDGSIYLGSETKIVAMDRNGQIRFRFDFPPDIVSHHVYIPGSPIVSADGSIQAGYGSGFVSISPAGEQQWVAWADMSGQALLDQSGRVTTNVRRGWDLGYMASEVVSYDSAGTWETQAVVAGLLSGMAIDQDGNYVVLAGDLQSLTANRRLETFSPEGVQLWSRELVDQPSSCSLAIDDQRQIRLACVGANGENATTVALVLPDGSLGWETLIPGVIIKEQIIVDQEGTTFIAGRLLEEDTAWLWAIDVYGAVKWSFALPGESASLLGMGSTGRLYVKTLEALVAVGDVED
jgi:hypothetical protein